MSVVPARSGGLDPEENAATLVIEGEIEEARERALVRVVRWRAAAIAERIFGTPLGHRVVGRGRPDSFRGMMEFEVGFDEFAAHREREAAFLAAVERDELLSEVPLIYLFTPIPTGPEARRVG